jgi:hypothetical protein
MTSQNMVMKVLEYTYLELLRATGDQWDIDTLVMPEESETANGPAWRFARVYGVDSGNGGGIIVKVCTDIRVKLLDVVRGAPAPAAFPAASQAAFALPDRFAPGHFSVQCSRWFSGHHSGYSCACPFVCPTIRDISQGVTTKINREISPYCILLFGL